MDPNVGILGDIGAAFLPFLEEFELIHERHQVIEDGYAMPAREEKVIFKGIAAPAKRFKFMPLGTHTQEGTFLYVPMNQESAPIINENDIVVDKRTNRRWRIMDENDY